MGRLDERVAVVTGAAGGFGSAIARRLHAEGARVALWDIREDDAVALGQGIAGDGTTLGVGVDIGDSAAVDAAAARTREALGPIDILVNNAGVVNSAPPWEVTDADWDWHFRVNSTGAYYCIRACLPDMRERRYGKIVNIGSVAAQQGRPTTSPAYAASKGAILGMTVSLARNLGADGICVNAVNPGFIKTVIHDQFSAEQLAPLMADIPLDRRGEPGAKGIPEDIAAAVAFLASPDSDFITGEYLSVNGGSRTGS
ncbi:glucose 1-dehydrogenase [Baekduia soli]|uniref:Glucose 1-dehydrogenase n=1 Tax=Baekduia soli TaxID=496014 RepID=A0A5B8U5H1_9ACTN|nr:glucose 1-dehydrogenase [Baekduia soli]QEC48088.1 glucose 1-dehydrogenase [Baekduia soli]